MSRVESEEYMKSVNASMDIILAQDIGHRVDDETMARYIAEGNELILNSNSSNVVFLSNQASFSEKG